MKPKKWVQRLAVPEPFELTVAVQGHGFVALAPNSFVKESLTFRTVLRDRQDSAVDVTVRQSGQTLVVGLDGVGLTESEVRSLVTTVRRMLRLDDDLSPFYQLCDGIPRLHWVARRGAGRLLRSQTVFEDLLKLLFTTNCSFAATIKMAERLVAALGPVSPSGLRAFPTPAACAEVDERFWRDVVKVGYRTSACRTLARSFAEQPDLEFAFNDPNVPSDILRDRLLDLPGFGPYAAGQALRLLGHYQDLALDSWCRARLAARQRKRKPPSDMAIARAYREFGRYQGLALWMDLTAEWFGEEPLSDRQAHA